MTAGSKSAQDIYFYRADLELDPEPARTYILHLNCQEGIYLKYTAVSATAISLVPWMVGARGGWWVTIFSVLTPRNPSKTGRQTANS